MADEEIAARPEPDKGRPNGDKEITERLYEDWKKRGLKPADPDTALLVSQKTQSCCTTRTSSDSINSLRGITIRGGMLREPTIGFGSQLQSVQRVCDRTSPSLKKSSQRLQRATLSAMESRFALLETVRNSVRPEDGPLLATRSDQAQLRAVC